MLKSTVWRAEPNLAYPIPLRNAKLLLCREQVMDSGSTGEAANA
jgi:hypothetical protein